MNITVILDIIVLCVLGVTIAFCWRLNNRIMELKSSKKDMASFVSALDTAVINAHKSVITLKETTEKSTTERQKYVTEGTELANDLSFIISSGNRLLQRLKDEMVKFEGLSEKSVALTTSLEIKISEFEKRRTEQQQHRHRYVKKHSQSNRNNKE